MTYLYKGCLALSAAAIAFTSSVQVAHAAITAAPPDGAVSVKLKVSSGVQFARYRTTKMTSKEVTAYYFNAFTKKNYRVSAAKTGKHFGFLNAQKRRSYATIQAGGPTGVTFFEVCSGTSKRKVQNCD